MSVCSGFFEHTQINRVLKHSETEETKFVSMREEAKEDMQ